MRKPRAPRPQSGPAEDGPLPPSVPPAAAGAGSGSPSPRGRAPRPEPTRGGRARRRPGGGAVGPASAASTASTPSAASTASAASAGSAGGGAAPSAEGARSHGRERGRGEKRSSELTVFSRRPAIELRREGRADRVVSTGLADRLAERRQALKRLRMRQVAIGIAVVVAIAALGWGLLLSPLLALRTGSIQVTGSDGSVQDGQVRDVLSRYEGRSLLRLDMAELSRSVSDDLVRVRSAQVARDWPRGLSVELEMRTPVAVRHTGGGVEVLDDEAVVLEVAPSAPQGLVTIVADAHSADDASGGGLSAEQVSAVARVAGALDPEVLARVTSGSASGTGQVTLTLDDGATVVWGDASSRDNARKARVLAVLLQEPAAVYDVSSKSPTTSQTPLNQAPGQAPAQEPAPEPGDSSGSGEPGESAGSGDAAGEAAPEQGGPDPADPQGPGGSQEPAQDPAQEPAQEPAAGQ